MAGISMLIRTYPKIFICIYLYAPPLAIGVIWDNWNFKKKIFTASGIYRVILLQNALWSRRGRL